MQTASVTEIKNRLSHYLRIVARGESVTVLDRGRPIAQLAPLPALDEEIHALAAAGLARPPLQRLPKDFFTRKLPKAKSSVVDELIEEREDRF
jgi:prevent-host-death family protein